MSMCWHFTGTGGAGNNGSANESIVSGVGVATGLAGVSLDSLLYLCLALLVCNYVDTQ